MGCAASPNRVTGPRPQCDRGAASKSAHLAQLSAAQRISRGGPCHARGRKRLRISPRSPGALQPVSLQYAQFAYDRLGGDERAPGGMPGEAGRLVMAEPAAQPRPQAVGPHQRDAAFLDRLATRMGGDRDAVAVRGEIVDAGPQAQHDVGIGLHRLEQGRLQIAAMDDPIGRAIALLGGGAERRAREHAPGSRIRHRELFRRRDMRRQPLAQAERDENT